MSIACCRVEVTGDLKKTRFPWRGVQTPCVKEECKIEIGRSQNQPIFFSDVFSHQERTMRQFLTMDKGIRSKVFLLFLWVGAMLDSRTIDHSRLIWLI